MLAAFGDDVRAAEDQASLGRTDQLVGGAGQHVDAFGDQLTNRVPAAEAVSGNIDHSSAPLVVEQRQLFRARDFHEFLDRWRFSKSDDVEVRAIDAQDRRCILLYYSCVIAGPGPIGRSHFAQFGTPLLDDIRNTKRAANLDQLSA